jgi:L-threonylcarbamoyladenylate synthase
VVEELGTFLSTHDLVLDGGACSVGVESTIIDCTNSAPRILRPGAISSPMIEESTGLKVQGLAAVKIRVSGSLESHYAPNAKVLLSESPTVGQGFIAHANFKTPDGVIRLASPQNDEEFAQQLYSALREADLLGLSEIVVREPIGMGIAIAIRDRLMRAANQL